ncbi:MAG: homoserine dehydrogenase [Streptococcaceae bacterium]|jgi:homoserine dehydrogenase|nr:homoserine dehydrogenase [Streptococcaceae bacterium]
MKSIQIALLGCGTVGAGVAQILRQNQAIIRVKTGVALEIAAVLVRDKTKNYPVAPELLTTDFEAILNAPEIKLVVELTNGIEPASSFMLRAMAAGKHVISANKAAVVANYAALMAASARNHVMFRYEAAVAGGIPILDALQAPLNSNDIEEINGIINGTTNFILTQMTENGWSYEQALIEAQKLGFAEADPTADVAGIDAANKLAILAAIAFGKLLDVSDIPTAGIHTITADDIAVADELGYTIKLLATVKKSENKLQFSVSPTLVPKKHLLANVRNEMNAVFVRGNAVGELIFYGAGAGGLPTGSAVVGDAIEIANALDKGAAFDSYVNQLASTPLVSLGEGENKYYIRLVGKNKPGVLGKIATMLGEFGVLITGVVQPETTAARATMIFTVGQCERAQLDAALRQLQLVTSELTDGAEIDVKEIMRIL